MFDLSTGDSSYLIVVNETEVAIMANKGNVFTPNSVTQADLKGYFEFAYRAFSRTKIQASEAVAYAYLAHRAVMYGPAKQAFMADITAYEDHATRKNDEQKARFKEADDYVKKSLRPDHPVYAKATTQKQKDEQQALIEKFKADAAITPAERRRMRYVSLANPRENTSPYMSVVRGSLRAYREEHNVLVHRYCLAMAWIHSRFKDIPDINVPMIKHAISVAHGFDAITEAQSKLNVGDNDDEKNAIIKKAIREIVRSKVADMDALAEIDMPVSATTDGYFLALARLVDGKTRIVSDARAPEVDIALAVNRVGSGLAFDVDPGSEFLGRAVSFADAIPEGQSIMTADGEKSTGKTSRLISLRPGENGASELVFSVNLAEAGSVLVARPNDPTTLGLPSGAGVVRTIDRRKLEAEVRDRGNRSLVKFTPDLNPTTADGSSAESLMSWNFVNEALARSDMAEKALTKVYLTKLENIANKPLDIIDFQPQLSGVLTGADIAKILELVPKPRGGGKNTDNDDDAVKAKSKTPRFVTLKFEKDQLFVSNGDAETLELDCKTGAKGTVLIRLRPADLWAVCNKLQEADCQNIRVSPDDRGLVQFAWSDTVGSYEFNQPTCGVDGRLQSRRIAPMRYEAPQQIAAE